jgi:hypothetical protein
MTTAGNHCILSSVRSHTPRPGGCDVLRRMVATRCPLLLLLLHARQLPTCSNSSAAVLNRHQTRQQRAAESYEVRSLQKRWQGTTVVTAPSVHAVVRCCSPRLLLESETCKPGSNKEQGDSSLLVAPCSISQRFETHCSCLAPPWCSSLLLKGQAATQCILPFLAYTMNRHTAVQRAVHTSSTHSGHGIARVPA